MFVKFVQWFLSKLSPFRVENNLSEDATFFGKNEEWDVTKSKEAEAFYCGHNGATKIE